MSHYIIQCLPLLLPHMSFLHRVQHLWLFFEMILKSVAHYLKEVGKLDKLVSVLDYL